MKDHFTSPAEQLDFIHCIMEDSRQGLEENGVPYIVWGAMAVLGTLASYGLNLASMSHFILPMWIGLFLCAGIILFFYFTYRKKASVHYFSNQIYSALWLGISLFGSSAGIISLLTGRGFSLASALTLISILLALGYLLSSILTGWKFLGVASIFWWLGGLGFLVVPEFWAPGLMAFLALVLELVPGIFLFRKSRPH